MPGKLVQVDSQGRIRVAKPSTDPRSGIVVAGAADSCCCDPPLPDCASCSDLTPSSYTVTFTGIMLCPCVAASGGAIGVAGTINNTTWCLPRTNDCEWKYELASGGPLTSTQYVSSTACTDVFSTNTRLSIRLAIFGDLAFGQHFITLRVLGGLHEVFFCTVARADGTCAGPFVLTDTRTACGEPNVWCGFGGTATITNGC